MPRRRNRISEERLLELGEITFGIVDAIMGHDTKLSKSADKFDTKNSPFTEAEQCRFEELVGGLMAAEMFLEDATEIGKRKVKQRSAQRSIELSEIFANVFKRINAEDEFKEAISDAVTKQDGLDLEEIGAPALSAAVFKKLGTL